MEPKRVMRYTPIVFVVEINSNRIADKPRPRLSRVTPAYAPHRTRTHTLHIFYESQRVTKTKRGWRDLLSGLFFRTAFFVLLGMNLQRPYSDVFVSGECPVSGLTRAHHGCGGRAECPWA